MPSQTFNSSGTWPVPADADPGSIRVQAWGEGGDGDAGRAGTSSFGAGGAGSGEYAEEAALGGLTSGLSVLTVTIGPGGSSTNTQVTGGSVAVVAHAGGNSAGITAGSKGTGSTNTIHHDGAAGGAGLSHTNPGGGSGAGAAGSSGAGNAGTNGGLGTAVPGGAGGTPDGGAGGAGGAGNTTGQPGQDGVAPGGAGGGGSGRSGGTAGGNGAPGRVIITWTVQPGVVVPVALVSITAPMPAPAASNLKVTATAGGSAVNGLLLRVRVLDNAALPTNLNTATQTSAAGTPGTPADVAFTPAATGSLAYSAVTVNSGTTPAAAASNTAVDSVSGHGTFVSTATLTANTPFTAGSAAAQTGGVAALEVTKFGGTISTDASSPAVVNASGATTATTAAFAPPTGNKLILALVSSLGGTGQVAMAVSDSFGLTWTQAVAADAAGDHYAGIWYAYSPANVAFVNIAPDPAVVGSSYSYLLSATGGYGNYGWTVATGSLPAGLSLNGSTGIISGTPTTAGLSTFTLTVSDGFGNSVTSGTINLVVNKGTAPGGAVPATWTGAARPYSYSTLDIPVANADHDWLFVSVSWVQSQEAAIAYVSDDAHNLYEPCAFTASGVNRTQVFSVPNARAASHVYVSTSAYVRWLTVCVTDVAGLQPGFTLDVTPAAVSGGPGTTLNLGLSTVQPDFILATGAFRGTPGTITPSGSGATWTSIGWGGINGSSSDGLTQAVAWAETSGSASPAMTFTGTSGTFSGCMVAVYRNGGLPVNVNPAWPVIKCQAAFGYLPHKPTAIPAWTDITSRFLGFKGGRGRSFELDEISAADVTVTLDNFDGALSPQNTTSPYYPNVTLITPVRLVAIWQGRTYSLFRGIIHAIPQTYDFQRGMVEVAASDDWSKLPQALLAQAMIQEMLYDEPLHLWPLNEQQGAAGASNWSGRSVQSLAPTAATLTAPVQTGGGTKPSSQFILNLFGKTLNVSEIPVGGASSDVAQLWAAIGTDTGPAGAGTPATPGPPPTPTTPTTGFGNDAGKVYPSGLMGTADSTWGNTTALTASNYYQGSVLVDSGDSSLPLASSTWSAWARMYYVPSNTSAVIMMLSDNSGSTGSSVYLKLSYDGTNITAAQTTGSHNFTPPDYLFDSKWHMWTVTVSSGGVIELFLDGNSLGTYTPTFPSGTPTMVQWGGDSTATTATAAGIFTGSQYLAAVYDQVADGERIASWARSGITGFLDELAGERVSRILTWARWGAPQAVDKGITKQQQFSYLGGGYASNGISGAVGNFATAGGAIGVDSGSQADMTIQDVANSENASLFMAAGGELVLRESDNAGPDVGIALGDMDYALNQTTLFFASLGEWTHATSCTVALSGDWSYASQQSALLTVTGTPSLAYVEGGPCLVAAGQQAGFKFWGMSPQGGSAQANINWYDASNVYISTSASATFNLPPMTPVFARLDPATAPAGAAFAKGAVTLVNSPATGTQLYFDEPRLSPAGFQASYQGNLQVVEDVQYLYNDIVLTRNVDQAGYRVRDAASRQRYYPRVYTRTVYSSVNDPQAVVDVAEALLSQFSQPQLRVAHLEVNAAADPENWDFVLAAGIGDSVSFSRHPVGGADVTGDFVVLHIEPDLGPDKANFTYVLAPSGFS